MTVLAADEPFRSTVSYHRETLREWVCEHRLACMALAFLFVLVCLVVL